MSDLAVDLLEFAFVFPVLSDLSLPLPLVDFAFELFGLLFDLPFLSFPLLSFPPSLPLPFPPSAALPAAGAAAAAGAASRGAYEVAHVLYLHGCGKDTRICPVWPHVL